jgi:hypothetical protein
MQITELDGKFIYSKHGVQIDNSVTKEELKAEWLKIKFISDTAKTIEDSIRTFSIEKFGEDETIELECDIITDLGFSLKVIGKEDKPTPIATAGQITRVFQKVDADIWKRITDKYASVETVKLYVNALAPIAERYEAAKKILEEKEAA